MLNAVFRPVDKWPGEQTPSWKRQRSRFRASYARTLDGLERELNAIQAKDIVIQCFLELRDIRNDGWPRSSARPKQPGVIVTFSQGKDAISMPCDTFEDWEQNLRAIALTLHSLRMVSQYGVSKHNEQYQGFKRLEVPSKESVRAVCAFAGDASGAEGIRVIALRKTQNHSALRQLRRTMSTTELLSSAVAAAWLGIHRETLKKWRLQGRSPSYVKLPGGAIRYRRSDLESYVVAHIVDATKREPSRAA
jgi:hypothetical protein